VSLDMARTQEGCHERRRVRDLLKFRAYPLLKVEPGATCKETCLNVQVRCRAGVHVQSLQMHVKIFMCLPCRRCYLGILMHLSRAASSSGGATLDLGTTKWALPAKPEEQGKDISDVTYDADACRPKRSYPCSMTPYVGPPYARPVVFVNLHANSNSVVGQDGDETIPSEGAS